MFRCRRRLRGGLLLAAAWLATAPASALSPEAEAERHYLSARAHMQNRDYRRAVSDFEKLLALKTDPPPEVFYQLGKALYALDDYTQARTPLETYVDKAGRDGSHYRDALMLLNVIEERIREDRAQEERRRRREAREREQQKLIERERRRYLDQRP